MPLNPLAMLAVQRNPALQGLLGSETGGPALGSVFGGFPQSPTPPSPQPGGNVGRLGALFGAQNQDELNQGLIQSGLATLAGSFGTTGPQARTPSLMEALAGGVAAGRQHVATIRQEAVEQANIKARTLLAAEQGAVSRLNRLREARRQEVMASVNLTDDNERLSALVELTQAGDLEGVRALQQIDEAMTERNLAQRALFLSEHIGNQIDISDPASILSGASQLAQAGLTDEAAEWRQLANSVQNIAQYEGELTWKDVGSQHVAVNRDNEVVFSLDKDIDPGEAARLAQSRELALRAEARDVGKEYLSNLNAISDDFRRDARPYAVMSRFARAAAGAPDNPAGDQTLVMSLNKMLDSMSAVREGEFNRVAGMGSVSNMIRSQANKILGGGELDREVAGQIRDEISRLSGEWSNTAERELYSPYRERAGAAGVDLNDFMIDYFEGLGPDAATGLSSDNPLNQF